MRTVRMEVMKNPTQIRLYDIFRKDLHMPDDRAQNLVSTINDALNEQREQDKEDLPTKPFVKEEISTAFQSLKDQIRDVEVRMTRQIYLVNIIQFLAIVGAILAIYNFLHK
jgi:hypothetical protein